MISPTMYTLIYIRKRINIYIIIMLYLLRCIDNPCGGFLSCCGNASYSNILTPPQSLIYLS